MSDLISAGSSEDVRLVQKGLMLYRQGMVSQLRMSNGEITATVQDVAPVKVSLDPESWLLSECSCPADYICRHKMAVFFAAYSRVASVSDWVTVWREPIREKKSIASWGLQAAKDLVRANGNMKPDYSLWIQTFESSFDTLVASKKYTNPYIVPELFEIYRKRVAASAPIEQEWRLLYELVEAIVSFRKLAVFVDEMGYNEDVVRRAYSHLFHGMLEDIRDLLIKIGTRALPFDFDVFIERLKDDAFELLTCTAGFELERVYVYRLLWNDLFRQKAWRVEEVLKIGDRLKELQDWENPIPLQVTSAHLYFLLGNDDLALKLINQAEEAIVPYLVYWFDYFSDLKAWKRLEPVLDLFLQKVKAYLSRLDSYQSSSAFVRSALRPIGQFCSETHRDDLYERALLAMLPYSFVEYEYVLFERKLYDRWAELLAFVGFEFYDLPKERVKLVEKEQPDVLLGMLHQTAQREIDQKNRSSYRVAVRHLKKLRTLYKKLRRVDDWEYFITELLERTKRLRAFQEECQRSKLI
ncbi:SWIM zinc finger family protein [Bacillus sp. JJ1764]